jgi:hypothetical protein
MRHLDRRLALTSECSENGAVGFSSLFLSKSRRNSILPKAPHRMRFEVRCRPVIFGVLITAHPVNALVAATGDGALEEMIFAAVVVADGDFGVKELVNRRAPALFEAR